MTDIARTASTVDRPPHAREPASRLIAFAATLLLAALTGLPRTSAAHLMPRADDGGGPFLGI